MVEELVSHAPVLFVSDSALKVALAERDADPGSSKHALFVEVSGAQGDAYAYDMWFADETEALPGDVVESHGDLRVVISAKSAPLISGATLDSSDEGLFVTNPNTPADLGGGLSALAQPQEAVKVAVLRLTDPAAQFAAQTRAEEPDASSLALFIEVNGSAEGQYTYDMWFEALADAGPNDSVEEFSELSVVVSEKSIPMIKGAVLDYGADGLFITNPNVPAGQVPSPPAVPRSDLSKPVELAVLHVLEHEVNPQIAAHGGRADLVAVDEDGVAYLTLSGGCQGCGLASVTLSQGISVALKDAVPEITDVVDVTDHEHGDNPYFTGAKK